MKKFFLPLVLCVSAAALLLAQKQVVQHVADGGVNEVLESIFIPPMVDAPFTCTLHTEWSRNMPEGGTLTSVNQRKIARQGNGRFYQERWFLVPKNGPMESRMSHIQIADPNKHTAMTCTVMSKVCEIAVYGGKTSSVYRPDSRPSGPLASGHGTLTNEPLGKDVNERVETVGTRMTETINPWVFGNDRAVAITREFWFAPSLGINLISKVQDPRFGSQSFTVTDLVMGEPDPQLFETPTGFTVKDERATAPPQQQ